MRRKRGPDDEEVIHQADRPIDIYLQDRLADAEPLVWRVVTSVQKTFGRFERLNERLGEVGFSVPLRLCGP